MLVAVVDQLGGAFGESGFLVIPGVAAHINQVLIATQYCYLSLAFSWESFLMSLQIIIDSMIVNWWRKSDQQFTTAN